VPVWAGLEVATCANFIIKAHQSTLPAEEGRGSAPLPGEGRAYKQLPSSAVNWGLEDQSRTGP
jgi:hypothetical protein